MSYLFRVGYSFVPTALLTPNLADNPDDYQLDVQVTHTTIPAHIPPEIFQETPSDTPAPPVSQIDLDSLQQTASQDFYRLFRTNETPTPTPILEKTEIIDETDDFKITFDQLAQKRLLQRAEENYNIFLSTREEKLRAEYNRLQEIEAYNADLANKAAAAKERDADKKKNHEDRKSFLRGLLFGDPYDESLPRPCLAILHTYPPEFFAIRRPHIYRVDIVDKIDPVAFGFGGGYYRPLRDVTISCRIKPRKQIIFTSIYRSWCNQFVRKIIEKRQRGPPLGGSKSPPPLGEVRWGIYTWIKNPIAVIYYVSHVAWNNFMRHD